MATWRTSTWVWLACVVAAIAGEVIYAAQDNGMQGRALSVLIVVSIVLAFYRGVTRRERADG